MKITKTGKLFSVIINKKIVSRTPMIEAEAKKFVSSIEKAIESKSVKLLREIDNLKSKSQFKRNIRNLLAQERANKSNQAGKQSLKDQAEIQKRAAQAQKDANAFVRKQLISELVHEVCKELKLQGIKIKVPPILEFPKESEQKEPEQKKLEVVKNSKPESKKKGK